MTSIVQTLLDTVEELSSVEQLQLIQAISHSLQDRYLASSDVDKTSAAPMDTIPANVKRSRPVQDLAHLAADFWPEDESADDINTFIARQRAITSH